MTRGTNPTIQKARAEGYWTHGPAPYGYKLQGTPPHRTLAPTEVADVVQEVFTKLAQGQTLPSIVNGLEGTPPPGKRPWSAQLIRELVRNPAYAGLIQAKGSFVVAQFDGIVSETTYNEANAHANAKSKPAVGLGAQQRDTFEEGFWHHQRAPRGMTRWGEWPYYVLRPNAHGKQYGKIIQLIASDAPPAEVLALSAPLFADVSQKWKDPSDALRRCIQRHVLHPAYGGFTVWANRTKHTEARIARWTPPVDRDVYIQARAKAGLPPLQILPRKES